MLKRIINWTLLIGIVFGAIIAIVALVELYCGYSYFKYKDTLVNQTHVIRFREPEKNADKEINTNGNITIYRTDSFGFILPHRSINNSNKVIFIGGSTTECGAVSEDNRPHVLLEKFSPNSTCLNIARAGNTSMHSHNNLLNKVLKYKPSYVIFNHNVNDLAVMLNFGTYWNKNRDRSLTVESTRELINYKVGMPKNWFVKKYIPYISLVLLPTTFEGEKLEYEFEDERIHNEVSEKDLLINFKSSLLANIYLIKSFGSKPIICTQASCFSHFPVSNDIHYENRDIPDLHKKFNEIIRDVAKESNTTLIDYEKALINKKSYFVDCIHLNDSGSIASVELLKIAFLN